MDIKNTINLSVLCKLLFFLRVWVENFMINQERIKPFETEGLIDVGREGH